MSRPARACRAGLGCGRLAALALAAGLGLAGCAETQLAGAVMKEVGRSDTPSGAGGIWKVGTPYQIEGAWYYPKEDPNYDRTGIASWYGPNFHRRKTANGEIFDMYKVSAAHPTLPMPVMVRVTNLENGRSLVVRVNDRGPFARGREIDLSMRAAEILGFKEKGTAKVRVQYLARADEWRGEDRPQMVQQGPAPAAPAPGAAGDEDGGPLAPAPIATAALPAPGTGAQAGAHAGSGLAREVALLAGGAAPQAAATGAASAGEGMMAPVMDAFYVQAGSFRSAQNAQALATQLSDLAPVAVESAIVEGTPWYRVKLGPVDGQQGADSLLGAVRARGQEGARLVLN